MIGNLTLIGGKQGICQVPSWHYKVWAPIQLFGRAPVLVVYQALCLTIGVPWKAQTLGRIPAELIRVILNGSSSASTPGVNDTNISISCGCWYTARVSLRSQWTHFYLLLLVNDYRELPRLLEHSLIKSGDRAQTSIVPYPTAYFRSILIGLYHPRDACW